MALIKGTRFDDDLRGTYLDDVIYGNGGDDVVIGNGGDDELHGGTGNDQIIDGYGVDEIHGDKDNDIIWGEYNPYYGHFTVDYAQDFVWGHLGDDGIIGGTGFDQLVGGVGNDSIQMMGGTAYGDQGPGIRQSLPGNDQIDTNLHLDYGTSRTITTGKGNDLVHVIVSNEYDGRSTNVTITDLASGQDRLHMDEYANDYSYFDTGNILNRLDSNHDGHVSGQDGWSYEGFVEANYQNNSLTLHVNEDSVTLLGLTDMLI